MIGELEDFFKSLGIPSTLTELGIDSSKFEEMAEHGVETEGLRYTWIPMEKEDVINILNQCL